MVSSNGFRVRKFRACGARFERAHKALLAADIKRFIERPVAETQAQRWMPASPAPPGAPIGDIGQGWLARPPY